MAANNDDNPIVSVIMPVYNVEKFVALALTSTIDQGMGPGEIEVIAVDDGSTDSSPQIIDEFAAKHDFITALHQENSGGPGGPRNTGLGVARGRYVFFLDSDDELTPGSLRELTDFADRNDSEMVVAKPGGLGGRKPPKSAFVVTKPVADLIEDNLFSTLGPWKLYRRTLIERLGLRFPVHLRRGEDPPFVARAYLGANRISILAEREYFLIRDRGDGTNLTATGTNPIESADRTEALVEAIVEGTKPGHLRQTLLKRPVRFNVPTMVNAGFLKLAPEAQDQVIEKFRTVLGDHYDDELSRELSPMDRMRAALAIAGDRNGLVELLEWDRDRLRPRVEYGQGSFRYLLPDGLATKIPADMVEGATARGLVRLEDVTLERSRLLLTLTISVERSVSRAPEVVVLVRHRDTGAEERWRLEEQVEADAAAAVGWSVRASVDTQVLTEGIWDLFVQQVFGGTTVETRVGATRAETIDTAPRVVDDGVKGRTAEVYYTNPFENLSLKVKLASAAGGARLVGLVKESAGLTALVSTKAAKEPKFWLVSGGVRSSLKSRRLSAQLHAVRLPRSPGQDAAELYFADGGPEQAVAPASGLDVPSEWRGLLRGVDVVPARRRVPPLVRRVARRLRGRAR